MRGRRYSNAHPSGGHGKEYQLWHHQRRVPVAPELERQIVRLCFVQREHEGLLPASKNLVKHHRHAANATKWEDGVFRWETRRRPNRCRASRGPVGILCVDLHAGPYDGGREGGEGGYQGVSQGSVFFCVSNPLTHFCAGGAEAAG